MSNKQYTVEYMSDSTAVSCRALNVHLHSDNHHGDLYCSVRIQVWEFPRFCPCILLEMHTDNDGHVATGIFLCGSSLTASVVALWLCLCCVCGCDLFRGTAGGCQAAAAV
jgi:hypothetical protein